MNFGYNEWYYDVIDMCVKRNALFVFGYIFAIQYTTKRLSVTFEIIKMNVDDNDKTIYSKAYFSKGFDAYLDKLIKARGSSNA
tara:strand:- start:1008 stop:1256 length:249 start_codon:yes stop_codon:yes gene_type:complete